MLNVKCVKYGSTLPKSELLDPQAYDSLPEGLRINITDSEPTVRPDFEEIVDVVHPKAALLELSTNVSYPDKVLKVVWQESL